MSIAGVVLAAGASTRLGKAKQLLADDTGESLLHRTARALLEAGCKPVFVITGADAEIIDTAVESLEVQVVHNHLWSEGIASSIRIAVNAAEGFQEETGVETAPVSQSTPTSIDALLFATCDMPTVDTDHFRALCAAYVSGAVRVASRYTTSGHRPVTLGIPAIIGAREWKLLMALQGDRGAKELLMSAGTESVELPGGTFDIDTPDDVARWRSSNH